MCEVERPLRQVDAVAGQVRVTARPRATRHATPPDGDARAYRIEGGESGDGGYVRSFAAGGPVLRFAEGTSMHLMPGARGRLGRIDAHGARFAIEQGEAEVKVPPRPGARWLIDVGFFLF